MFVLLTLALQEIYVFVRLVKGNPLTGHGFPLQQV